MVAFVSQGGAIPAGHCEVTRISPFTGQSNTLRLPVEADLVGAYLEGRDPRMLQDVFPDLSAGDREFIKTGYTEADWAAMFPKEDEEEEE